jgi:hypothetical protein
VVNGVVILVCALATNPAQTTDNKLSNDNANRPGKRTDLSFII